MERKNQFLQRKSEEIDKLLQFRVIGRYYRDRKSIFSFFVKRIYVFLKQLLATLPETLPTVY